MSKNSITLLVALLIVTTMTALPAGSVGDPREPGGRFVDDDTSVHEAAIEAIATEDITRGCNPPWNYWFCPDKSATRGQMAAFLARAFELPAGSRDFFRDDGEVVFEGDISAVAEAGITRGCNPPANDHFCPHDPVSRGQMAGFLHRALTGTLVPADRREFVDDDESVFEADIEWLGAADVTRGCNPPDNTMYCPNEAATRGQMASFLARALRLAQTNPPSPTLVAVLSVIDGDTIRVLYEGSSTPLRFAGITTPQQGQICYEEATQAMEALVQTKTVRIDRGISDRDEFNRLLGYVFMRDGTFVNEEIIRLGWAEATPFESDPQFAFLFASVEEEARAAGRGRWNVSANCETEEEKPEPLPDTCHDSYPDTCIPPPPPDLDCADLEVSGFTVLPPDPHNLDSDGNGVGCGGVPPM